MDEIREAISHYKSLTIPMASKHMQALINLAERYLSANGIFKKINYGNAECSICGNSHTDYRDGYNDSSDDGTLTLTKKLDGLEEVIDKYHSPYYSDFPNQHLVNDIRDHILGR